MKYLFKYIMLLLLPAGLYGQCGRISYAGVELIGLSNRTASLSLETRVQKKLAMRLGGGYTFNRPQQGIAYSRHNLVKGAFFSFGPRLRLGNKKGKDLYYAGIVAASSFYTHTATLDVPGNYTSQQQNYLIKGNTAGFIFQQGFSFRPLANIQVDAGTELGMLRPRYDVLGMGNYYQPGFGYVDKGYFNNMERKWKNTFCFTITLSYIFGKPCPQDDGRVWVMNGN